MSFFREIQNDIVSAFSDMDIRARANKFAERAKNDPRGVSREFAIFSFYIFLVSYSIF